MLLPLTLGLLLAFRSRQVVPIAGCFSDSFDSWAWQRFQAPPNLQYHRGRQDLRRVRWLGHLHRDSLAEAISTSQETRCDHPVNLAC